MMLLTKTIIAPDTSVERAMPRQVTVAVLRK